MTSQMGCAAQPRPSRLPLGSVPVTPLASSAVPATGAIPFGSFGPADRPTGPTVSWTGYGTCTCSQLDVVVLESVSSSPPDRTLPAWHEPWADPGHRSHSPLLRTVHCAHRRSARSQHSAQHGNTAQHGSTVQYGSTAQHCSAAQRGSSAQHGGASQHRAAKSHVCHVNRGRHHARCGCGSRRWVAGACGRS